MTESRSGNPDGTDDRPVVEGQPMFKGDFEEPDYERNGD
jgi:hypothetical protein